MRMSAYMYHEAVSFSSAATCVYVFVCVRMYVRMTHPLVMCGDVVGLIQSSVIRRTIHSVHIRFLDKHMVMAAARGLLDAVQVCIHGSSTAESHACGS
jgi:hypothetical protein